MAGRTARPESDMLQFILEQAPKKKNGTLHKNRLTYIAGMPVILTEDMGYYFLTAKAKNDTTLDVTVQYRTFSEKIWAETKYSRFLKGLEQGVKSTISRQKKTAEVMLFSPDKKYNYKIKNKKIKK